MSKRDAYFATLEGSKQKTLGSISPKSNSVDAMIDEMNSLVDNSSIIKREDKTEKKIIEVEKNKKEDLDKNIEIKDSTVSGVSEISLNDGFKINVKTKEVKSIRKSFLLCQSVNDKFSALAKETNTSENELINTILKQVFGL